MWLAILWFIILEIVIWNNQFLCYGFRSQIPLFFRAAWEKQLFHLYRRLCFPLAFLLEISIISLRSRKRLDCSLQHVLKQRVLRPRSHVVVKESDFAHSVNNPVQFPVVSLKKRRKEDSREKTDSPRREAMSVSSVI